MRSGRIALRRRLATRIMGALAALAALAAILPLVVVFGYLVLKGASSLNLSFFLHNPRPVGVEGGGMANAIVGTLVLILVASILGVAVGLGAGMYLAEHGSAPLATAVRFFADVLNGLPSIVIGIFAWQLLVRPFGHFSALSGGVALGLMMIPTVARTTEEMILTVPTAL
ncbi:MAG TPA: ABC transporter permease subunit, partial [Longimicrobiales bacterium]